MSTRHPELMKPALEAQRIVMKKTFGKRFWAKKTKFRVKQYELQNVFRCGDAYVAVHCHHSSPWSLRALDCRRGFHRSPFE